MQLNPHSMPNIAPVIRDTRLFLPSRLPCPCSGAGEPGNEANTKDIPCIKLALGVNEQTLVAKLAVRKQPGGEGEEGKRGGGREEGGGGGEGGGGERREGGGRKEGERGGRRREE